MKHLKSPHRAGGILHAMSTKHGQVEYIEYALGRTLRVISLRGSQARQLVITAHGGYAPWSGEVPVPPSTTLKFFNPHGTALGDPGLSTMAMADHVLFASVSNHHARLHDPSAVPAFSKGKVSVLSGSRHVGTVRNYYLAKYAGDSVERMVEAADFVADFGIESDFLAIRNRRILPGIPSFVTLRDVFEALRTHRMHYDSILCLFCRESIFRDGASYHAITPGFG